MVLKWITAFELLATREKTCVTVHDSDKGPYTPFYGRIIMCH